jgi:PIN domain nuclease of toxin-antitoxin system
MKCLLDTHTLIWAITEPNKLSKKVRSIIETSENQILVSSISFWEISLKSSLGKLSLENIEPEDFPKLCAQMDIEVIAVDAISCSTYHHLNALHHRDPFDRMLIWQAKCLNIPILSKDESIKLYDPEWIQVIW